MKSHRVRISEDAELDLVDLYHHIAAQESVERAGQILDQLETLCASLSELPERGLVPPELDRIGVLVFREVHFKPYRVIYEVSGAKVLIHCVLDGRRDMQALLERRLLR